jgi:outer membrane lipoprotein-sorting protein
MAAMARLVRLRPLVGVVAALLIAGGGLALAGTRSSDAVQLASTTPQRLVAAMVRAAEARPSVSGTVLAHVAIGLPTLSDGSTTQVGAAGLSGLLGYGNGDHQIRVWSSRDGLRVAELVRPAAELSYVANDRAAWAWNSDRFTAYRFPLPKLDPFTPRPASLRRALSFLSPDGLARLSIQSLTPTSLVGLGAPTRVAGRPAYALDIIPRTSATLVGKIQVDVDARTHLPLSAGVYARGASTPALSVAYQTVSFASIAPSAFAFTPPAGARVVDVKPGGGPGHESVPAGVPGRMATGIRTSGSGWATVVAVPTPSLAAARALAGGLDPSVLLPITGPLFSARFLERGGHGWLLFGAVPQSRLAAVAATLG